VLYRCSLEEELGERKEGIVDERTTNGNENENGNVENWEKGSRELEIRLAVFGGVGGKRQVRWSEREGERSR